MPSGTLIRFLPTAYKQVLRYTGIYYLHELASSFNTKLLEGKYTICTVKLSGKYHIYIYIYHIIGLSGFLNELSTYSHYKVLSICQNLGT